MRFLILNLTDRPIPITRTNMKKVTLEAHKPYLLETMHTPEINFWQKCTDRRFKILTNATEIDRYLKVVANQANISKESNAVTTINTPAETKISNETEVVNKEQDNKTVYAESDLVSMKVVELKELASSLKIQLPANANKATIITTIMENQ